MVGRHQAFPLPLECSRPRDMSSSGLKMAFDVDDDDDSVFSEK